MTKGIISKSLKLVDKKDHKKLKNQLKDLLAATEFEYGADPGAFLTNIQMKVVEIMTTVKNM